MNERYTYDPEDLESLLRHKSFSELYPEEREFVLKHLSGEDEYTSMHTLLENLESVPEDAPPLREDHKAEVMAAYRKAKRRPTYSLNQFFAFLWPADQNFFQRPAFALGVLVVLFAGYLAIDPFSPNGQDGLLAEHTEKMEVEEEMETKTKAKTEAETETEMNADSYREETEIESQVAESADVNERVQPEGVEEVMANELPAEFEDEEIVEEVATASAESIEDDVDNFDRLADVPTANRVQTEAGVPAQDSESSLVYSNRTQVTDDSVAPIENPVVTFSSPEVISSKSVSAESATSVSAEDIAKPVTVELLKRKDQKKLMKLMYSAY